MHDQRSVPEFRVRAVRLWLLTVAAMIFLTLVIGGATRLTVSGLSIVEWKPVTGVLPPLSETAWQAEFEKYQAIPQYRELNRGMSLDEFKVIYWWEWTHRLLARATGAVFLLPFLLFLWRGAIPPPLRPRLWMIFTAGAVLGVVGWWMVASGLAGTLTKVSQYRLAFHLTLACAIYAAVLWTAQQIAPRAPSDAPKRLRLGALAIAALLLVQIYLGALVAGLDAGIEIQHLADDRWRIHAVARPAVVHQRRSGAICSRMISPFSSTIACWPMRSGCWRCCMDLTPGGCAARGARRDHFGGRGDAAGRARHRHAALSGAAPARARAPGRWRSWFSLSR